MSPRPKAIMSHFGACVSDMDRAVRFYTEALGFEIQSKVALGPPFERTAELPELKGRATFLFHPSIQGLRFELLEYEAPGWVGPSERRAMNQLGYTHMSLIVEEFEELCARIEALGGRAHWHTRVTGPRGDLMFVTDPDGLRIELWLKSD